jgi:hypothetical protein
MRTRIITALAAAALALAAALTGAVVSGGPAIADGVVRTPQ